MYKDENGVQSAQSLIYTYKKELWERDWKAPALDKTKKMNHLEKKLEEMGYYMKAFTRWMAPEPMPEKGAVSV